MYLEPCISSHTRTLSREKWPYNGFNFASTDLRGDPKRQCI